MTIRTLIYLVILLLIINVAALVTIVYNRVSDSDRQPHFPEAPPAETDGLLPPTERELGFLRETRMRFDSTLAPQLEAMRGLRVALFEELRADNPDTAKISRAISDIGVLQTAVQRQLVQRFLDDRDQLRPEQRRRFLKMIEERLMNRPAPFRGRPRDGFGPKER